MRARRGLGAVLTAGLMGAFLAGCGGATPPPPAAAPSAPPASVAPSPSAPATSRTVPPPGVRRLPPDQQDPAFLSALADRKLTVANSQPDTVRYGHLICTHLDANEPVPSLLTQVQSSAQLGTDDAGYVLGAASAAYCPENIAKLPQ